MLALRQSLRICRRTAVFSHGSFCPPSLLAATFCSDGAGSSGSSSSDQKKPLTPGVPPPLPASGERLFRVARVPRASRAARADTIDYERAMLEYGLSDADLADLPYHAHRMFPYDQRQRIYHLHDVHRRALEMHGGDERALEAFRRGLRAGPATSPASGDAMQLRLRAEAVALGAQRGGAMRTMHGADRVVRVAFFLNAMDATSKFAAAYVTGSASLFAEGVHSTMDTINQAVLFLGIKYSHRNPDPSFPYGYGNARYITSLISGCGILSFGCGLSMYHGIVGLLHPVPLEPLTYGFFALFLSICFQGLSLANAFREVRGKSQAANMSILSYVRTSADPSLNVVLLEDAASVGGVCIALGAITASSYLSSSIPDSCGSMCIGALLWTVAYYIIKTNAAHLVGRSLPKAVTDDIVGRLHQDKMVRKTHDVKTTSLGVETSRFKAELDFNGAAVTSAYLKACDMDKMLAEVQRMKTTDELHDFMTKHGDKVIEQLGDEVDRIELEITARHPDVRHIDLEAH